MTRCPFVLALSLFPALAHAQRSEEPIESAPEAPATSPEEAEMPAELWAGLGAGMLAAGVGLDALLFLVTDERVFRDSSGESGLALAFPPVLVAGGLEMLTIGVASALGADDLTALRIGSLANVFFGLVVGAVALAIGADPRASVGNYDHEHAAAYLAANGGAAFLVGGGTLALSFW